MISLGDAIQAYLDTVCTLDSETVALTEGLGRVLRQDLHADIDLPRFDQSAMDGYAFRAENSASAPTTLEVCGEAAAGHTPSSGLETGTAWRIFTGAPLPEGADTVIPQEAIVREGDRLLFGEAYPRGCNIRYQGEEVRAGALLAQTGQRLTPGLIASLANAGILDVSVTRKPRIAVLITGDEVRSPLSLRDRPLGESEIPDSNGTYICNWLAAHGHTPITLSHITDTAQAVSDAIAEASEQADLVITTGGASVGDRDFIPSVAQETGFEQIFWRVAQKPGKPLFFSRNDNRLLLGLPGNPGAVLVGMEVHARTILNLMEGQASPEPAWRNGCLADTVKADTRRDRLVRMHHQQDDEGRSLLTPLGHQDSHMLSNLSLANALVHLPHSNDSYPAGSVARYLPLS